MDVTYEMQCNYFINSSFYFLCLGFNFLDDVLQPTVPPQSQRATVANQQNRKILANDLDSSLANLVGSKCEAFKNNFPICYWKQNKLFSLPN